MKRQLDEIEARAMTVNERLVVSGLLENFDRAVAQGDVAKLQEILGQQYLDTKTIQEIIVRVLPQNSG